MAIYNKEDIVAYSTKQGFVCDECYNDGLDEISEVYTQDDLEDKVAICDRCQKEI